MFEITQSDTATSLVTTLTDSGVPVDISGYNEVRFHMVDGFDAVVIDDDTTGRVNVISDVDGEVEYVFGADDASVVGTYYAEWEVEYGDGSIETFPTSKGKIEIEIIEELA